MQSASLQQQLARNRMLQKAASIKTPAEYFEGERISHNIFGEGVIVSVQKMANDALLEIAFDKVGTKKIMANFAKLKKI